MILQDVIYEPEPVTDFFHSNSFPWILLIVLLVILIGTVYILIRHNRRK